jgi:hypothetical protein
MEQLIKKPRRFRRTQDQILLLLKEFDKSRMTAKDFCVIHKVGRASFHKWQSRYKRGRKKINNQPSFTRVQISPSPGHAGSVLFAEVKGIKIYGSVPAA